MRVPFTKFKFHFIKDNTLNGLLTKIQVQGKQIDILLIDNRTMAIALGNPKRVLGLSKPLRLRKSNENKKR